MTEPSDQDKAKKSNPPRSDEAKKIISDYVDDLREIIRKLRRKMD